MGKRCFIERPVINRDEVILDAITKCRDAMFKASYPSITYEGFVQKCKEASKDGLKDILDGYYLPDQIYNSILEDFLDAYRFPSDLKDTVDILKNYCKDPIVSKYIKPEDGSPGYKGYDHPEPMSEEHFKETEKYLDMAARFFNWNRDESVFRYALADISPCGNRDVVEKYHHDRGELDFKIPDDSYWVDTWDENFDESEYEEDCES